MLAFVWLAGCGGPPRGGPGGPPGRGPMPPPEVVTVTVSPQRVVLTKELPARTAAYRVAEIRPQVSGLIQNRFFTEGAEVAAGELLYQIDPAPYQAALDNAKAALARGEAQLPALQARVERFEALLADHGVSRQDYDDAVAALRQGKAAVEAAKAAVESAQINLAYTRITSPIAGRIGRSTVTEGAIVTAYQPVALATVHQLDPIYVDAPQATAEVLRWRRRWADAKGATNDLIFRAVELLLEDGTLYPEKGELQFREVTVDPSSATVVLRTVFPNPKRVLLPGMFVRLRLTEGVLKQAIRIPQPAVQRDPKGRPYVWVVGSDRVPEQRHIEVDRAIDDQWLVTDGLEAGERVIVEGLQRVMPGVPVRLAGETNVPPAGPAAGRPPAAAR